MTSTEWAKFRVGLIADTIQEMFTGKKAPRKYTDSYKLAKDVVDTFYKNGGVQILAEVKSKWGPGKEYVLNHMHVIQEELGNQRTPFIYYRKQGEIKGEWIFPTKDQLLEAREREASDIDTRVDHYNEKVDADKNKYPHLPSPHLRLTERLSDDTDKNGNKDK